MATSIDWVFQRISETQRSFRMINSVRPLLCEPSPRLPQLFVMLQPNRSQLHPTVAMFVDVCADLVSTSCLEHVEHFSEHSRVACCSLEQKHKIQQAHHKKKIQGNNSGYIKGESDVLFLSEWVRSTNTDSERIFSFRTVLSLSWSKYFLLLYLCQDSCRFFFSLVSNSVHNYACPLFPSFNSVEHIVGNLVMQLILGIPLELVHKGFEVGMVYMAGVLAGVSCNCQ